MDNCHFWEDNYFHLLFHDSTPPYVENIMESSHKSSLNTIFQYFPVLVCYAHEFLDMEGYTYLDPHDQCRYLEHHFWLSIEFQYLHMGVHISTWTWNPCLQWILDYFNIVAITSTWDPSSPTYFNTMVHTYTWDPGSPTYFSTMVHTYTWDTGIWLYFLITIVENKTFLRGVECSVARGIIWGT
jgi:hypothetical protein